MMKPSAYLLIQDLGEVAALLPSPGLGPLKLSQGMRQSSCKSHALTLN